MEECQGCRGLRGASPTPRGGVYNPPMKIELTKELIDDVVFAMEDQGAEMALDLKRSAVVCVDGDAAAEYFLDELDGDRELSDILAEEGRFARLPPWGPAEGFRLMERFVAGLKNPPARQALRDALAQKKGVFRAFKDALRLHPEAERLWFAFKDEEMGRAVRSWLEALAEERELALLGPEPEDSEEAVLGDFSFGFPAELPAAFAPLRDALLAELREAPSAADFTLVASSASGEAAGLVLGRRDPDGNLAVSLLGVAPEFRGLGLAAAMLRRTLAEAPRRGFGAVGILRPESAAFLDALLEREGMVPAARLWKAAPEARSR